MNGSRFAIVWGLFCVAACANGNYIQDTESPFVLTDASSTAAGGSAAPENSGGFGGTVGAGDTGNTISMGGFVASGGVSGSAASGNGGGPVLTGGTSGGSPTGGTAGAAVTGGGSGGGAGQGDAAPMCQAGEKVCGGVCALPTPNIGCGLGDCTKCPNAAPANGFLKCVNGACDFDCFSGYAKSGSSCKSASGGDGGPLGACDKNSCPSCGTPTFIACCTKSNSCGCTEAFAFGFAPCN
jgi:hypothetical protein